MEWMLKHNEVINFEHINEKLIVTKNTEIKHIPVKKFNKSILWEVLIDK